MKNYTTNVKDAKTFIKNYTIKDNLITIQLALGEEEHIPYTKENEQKILERMEEQVRNAGENIDKLKKDAKEAKIELIYFGKIGILFLGLVILTQLLFIGPFAAFTIPLKLALVCSIFALVLNSYVFYDAKSKVKDFEKNKLYLESKEQIEESDFSKNGNLLKEINEKTKTMMQVSPKENININTMNKIKYRELKQILENIKRERNFGFDYSQVEKKEDKKLGEQKLK